MRDTYRQLVTSHGFAIGFGLVIGASSAVESWAPLVLAAAAAFGWVSLKRPSVPILFAFIGILFDAIGLTGIRVLGLPVTLGKISVLYALGAHLLHRLMSREPLFRATPVTTGLFAILLTMLASLVNAVDPTWGYSDVMGAIMLTLLVHLVYDTVDEVALPWILRGMGIAAVSLMLWTLLTQRKMGFFVTLDAAWQQRTSGAFGDPNAWCTALLVVCPILIGALAADKHKLATPILMGLMVTFPAGVVQSMSRAGLVTFIVISPGLLYLMRGRKTMLMTAGLALLVAIPFVVDLDAALLRYQTLLDPTLEADLGRGSISERRALAEAALEMFFANPVLGVGAGLFRVHSTYVSPGEVWKVAHNSYLNVAAEQGSVGILAHLYLGALIYRAAWHGVVRTKTELTRAVGAGLFVSLLAFSAMAFTLNLNTFAIAYYMLGFGLMVCRLGGSEEVIDRLEQARADLADASLPADVVRTRT